jgi:hypothetical protein
MHAATFAPSFGVPCCVLYPYHNSLTRIYLTLHIQPKINLSMHVCSAPTNNMDTLIFFEKAFYWLLICWYVDFAISIILYFWQRNQFWKLVHKSNTNISSRNSDNFQYMNGDEDNDNIEMNLLVQEHYTEHVQWNDESPLVPHTRTTNASAYKGTEQCLYTTITLDSLPLELIACHIVPFVGDYQYRFVGSVNRKLHQAYSMTLPNKQTYVNMSTIPHSKICWSDSVLSNPPIAPTTLWRVAVRQGNLLVLQYLKSMDFVADDDTCVIAAEYGHLDILQWVRTSSTMNCAWDKRICENAAKNGHLHVLQYARGGGGGGGVDGIDCPWDADTCAFAAENGHLAALQWARANGCEWDSRVCFLSAKNGHLDILQWARPNGCLWSEETCADAALNGHLLVLQWARANGCEWDSRTCSCAARNGHLHVLKWAHRNGCEWYSCTCSSAALNGHLHVLQWAHRNGCPWHSSTCEGAARNGHLEALQWARANGCDWDSSICEVAAENGHLEVLQWAHTNGCPWSERTCFNAAANGNLLMLQYARNNGCPWDKMTCYCAATYKHLAVLQWARANGCPWDFATCANEYYGGIQFGKTILPVYFPFVLVNFHSAFQLFLGTYFECQNSGQCLPLVLALILTCLCLFWYIYMIRWIRSRIPQHYIM